MDSTAFFPPGTGRDPSWSRDPGVTQLRRSREAAAASTRSARGAGGRGCLRDRAPGSGSETAPSVPGPHPWRPELGFIQATRRWGKVDW